MKKGRAHDFTHLSATWNKHCGTDF